MICEGAITHSLGKICSSFRSDLWAIAWWQSKPQNLHCVHRLTEGTRRDPRSQQYNHLIARVPLACSQLPVWSMAFALLFFSFMPWSWIPIFQLRKFHREKENWSMKFHLHKAQKHLSRAPCQRSEHQERDTAGRLPLIKCILFLSIGARSESVWRHREERIWPEKTSLFETSNQLRDAVSLINAHKRALPQDQKCPVPFNLTCLQELFSWRCMIVKSQSCRCLQRTAAFCCCC